MPNTEHARDAVADTMSRAVSGIERFADRGNGFDAWLSGIHRHVVIDTYRRLSRERPVDALHLSAAPRGGVLHESEASDVDECLAVDEEAVALRRAFASLSAWDQRVLELRVVEGLSVQAVARTLGRRPGAVRMAQSRALVRLRRALAADQQEDARVSA